MADDRETQDAEELMASLRHSEARLRGVLDSISDGFYAVGRDWVITEFNPAAENYFKLKRDDVVGRQLWDFIANASPEFVALLRAAMDGAPMSFLESQSLLRPDRWVELRIVPTEEGLCVALSDITARKRANEEVQRRLEAAVAERTEALVASENRLRTIIETSHLFQALMNTNGLVLEANAASLEAISARKPDVIGREYWDTPWFTGTPGMVELVRGAIGQVAAGESFAQPISLILPTGARSFDFTIRPVRDASGAVLTIVAEANETTARLKAEEELRQAQKLEAVGQLTGGVAHDFNNLLMVISGGINMLERQDTPERRTMIMGRMQEAVTRGANLTRQLLAFSRRHELSPEPIDLAAYLNGMNDLLDRSLGGNVSVVLNIPDNISPIRADPNALQLAILNLAVNARDAMPDGGDVTITAFNGHAEDADALFVSLAVSDSGIGMAPEVRARVFEPFFTTKEVGKGSGLGLAQVHGFAEQTGGRVEIQSEPGQGATITLILPRSDHAPVAQQSETTPDRAGATQPAGNLLLVEDDDEVAALTSEMLEHLGWRVSRVASAEAALGALAQNGDVQLVFSDVMMPGGQSGIDLARAIRARRADLPIVLASGYAEAVRRDAESEGIPLLNKPFTIDTLAATIEAARS